MSCPLRTGGLCALFALVGAAAVLAARPHRMQAWLARRFARRPAGGPALQGAAPQPPAAGAAAAAGEQPVMSPTGERNHTNATTALCICGAVRQGHQQRTADTLLQTAARFDEKGDLFAYVNPCDNPNPGYPGQAWYGGKAVQCANGSQSAFVRLVMPRLRLMRFYSGADVAPPPTSCPKAWPSKGVARYYSQHIGWKRCFELVEEEERRRGAKYHWVVKLRADLVAHRSPDPEHNQRVLVNWALLVARPVSTLQPDAVWIPEYNAGMPLFVNDHMFAAPRHLANATFSTSEEYLKCETEADWAEAKKGLDWMSLAKDGRWWYPNDLPPEVVLGRHLRREGVPWKVLPRPPPPARRRVRRKR